MKILIVTNIFPKISETFVRDHVIELLDRNFKVDVLPEQYSYFEEKALLNFEKYDLRSIVKDLDIPTNKPKRIIKALIIFFNDYKNISQYLKTFNFFKYGITAFTLVNIFKLHFIREYDIIHAHFGQSGEKVAGLKNFGFKGKIITTFHGYDIRQGLNEGSHIYKNLIKHADKIISISAYNKYNLKKMGFPQDKIVDISNGIDTTFFMKKLRIKNNTTFKFLTVGRLVKDKNISFLIQSFYNFLSSNNFSDRIELAIIGDGDEKEMIENLIQKYKIEKFIKLLGSKSSLDVKNEMERADVFVLSSINEALPTVLLEAQAMELPIISTNVGSIKNMVDSKSNWLIPSNDINALTQALKESFDMKENLQKIGERNRKNVIINYNRKDKIDQLLELYKE